MDASRNLLEYLAAVAREIGPQPIRDLSEFREVLLPKEVPNHGSVGVGTQRESAAWLTVKRLPKPTAVGVPKSIDGLIDPEIGSLSPSMTPSLNSEAMRIRAKKLVLDEFGPITDTDDDLDLEVRSDAQAQIEAGLRQAFDAWKEDTWAQWVERTRPLVDARALYSKLYSLHLTAETESATHELVWGHAILSVCVGGSDIVAPLLTTRVVIEMDQDDATIRVIPEGPVGVELDAVEGSGLLGLEGLASVKATIHDAPPDPWSEEERLDVRRKLAAPLGVDAELVSSMNPVSATDSPRINDGWALILRRRPYRQERFYAELSDKLRADGILPESLASVVADRDRVDAALTSMGRETLRNDGTAARLMMPLPVNDEQVRIASQLATSRGVTVQGPPGTGKSHTIVNLVSHLVAQGKRVLVTAEKEQALTVLRDKIPEPLRDLSLAVVGSTPSAMEDLRASAQAMQDSLSAIDSVAEERRIAELGKQVDELRDRIARTDAELTRALASEQREYETTDGKMRASEVAQWLSKRRSGIVIQDQIHNDAAFPLGGDEFAELCGILRQIGPDERQAALQGIPEASWVPSAAELQAKLVRREELQAAVTELENHGLRVEALDGVPADEIRDQARWLEAAASFMREISGEWEDRLAAAVRANHASVAWLAEQQAPLREKLFVTSEHARALAGRTVAAPVGDPVAQLSLIDMWAERISTGKKLGWRTPKEVRDFAGQVTVDGYTVTTEAQLDLVRELVKFRVAAREAHVLMHQGYAPAGIPVPDLNDQFLFEAQSRIDRVERVREWWFAVFPEVRRRIAHFAHPFGQQPLTAETIEGVVNMLHGSLARFEERAIDAELVELTAKIRAQRALAGASPLWGALQSALELGRPTEWDTVIQESARLRGVRENILRADSLSQRVKQAGAPLWMSSVEQSHAAQAVTGDLDEVLHAWETAKARAWIASLHSSTDVETLMERGHRDSRALGERILDLASRSARVELKRNFKDRQRRALDTWLTAVKRIGKGTGKQAPRYQAAARAALPAAMGAVPIWIMPIYRVMENFDPQQSDLFDVVIIDESSQCDLLSLGVMALGKKTVVVGDDKQTTPEVVGVQTDRIAALQDHYLKGIPGAKLLTLDDSLYSVSSRAFPSVIALKEHFRCVPEIIGFSNRFYKNSIFPLREVGVPEIGDPLRAVFIEDAVSMNVSGGRVNRDEARAIASQVAACARDEAYAGLTFGVVTMMSGPQSQIIQDLIREEIGDEEFENRKLRVGNPPVFQGDERNVIFVSMVAHDSSFAATNVRYAQWTNVAASRAKDQLWVFHSMDPATLHHDDYRRELIEYASSYGRRDKDRDTFSLTESDFERDVLKQMIERGLRVEAQHQVGRYRIDFVVHAGPGERLAVECDGDSFHGPDKWDEDVRRQRVLERLGWSFWRIRASKYYLDPEEAMQPLWARVEKMKARAQRAKEVVELRRVNAESARLERLRDAEREEQALQRTVSTAQALSTESNTGDSHGGWGVAGAEESRSVAGRQSSPAVQPITANDDSVPPRKPASVSASPSTIRKWARSNGYAIGERGRVPSEIAAAFKRAHSKGSE
ncbi:AAA domain-containing protein [Galactobacter valiniphilus]|uniref:AAA domain-containing protein n=1 Tax=Galactobacter valiniphilus TaxID=2676122 RepID=UPI003736F073